MKVLINEFGVVIGTYHDTIFIHGLSPIEPTVGPNQTLIELPENVIGEALTHIIGDKYVYNQSLIDLQWLSVKTLRNRLLFECDWTCSVTDFVPWNKSEWVAYRQALRNISKAPNPFQVKWPIPPSSSSLEPPIVPVVPEPVSPVEPLLQQNTLQ
jgi:hypothetical protein